MLCTSYNALRYVCMYVCVCVCVCNYIYVEPLCWQNLMYLTN